MDRSLAVAKDLNLDVAGAFDEALQVEATISEGRERLGGRLRDQRLQFGRRMCDADTAGPRRPRPL